MIDLNSFLVVDIRFECKILLVALGGGALYTIADFVADAGRFVLSSLLSSALEHYMQSSYTSLRRFYTLKTFLPLNFL